MTLSGFAMLSHLPQRGRQGCQTEIYILFFSEIIAVDTAGFA